MTTTTTTLDLGPIGWTDPNGNTFYLDQANVEIEDRGLQVLCAFARSQRRLAYGVTDGGAVEAIAVATDAGFLLIDRMGGPFTIRTLIRTADGLTELATFEATTIERTMLLALNPGTWR